MGVGRKPKNPQLRLVEGSNRTNRHGVSEDELREQVEKSKAKFGPPVCPDDFDPARRKIWSRYIEPCWWLTRSREHLAVLFCNLWAKYLEDPDSFPIGKIAQIRSVSADLGLSDERNRVSDEESEKDEFFD